MLGDKQLRRVLPLRGMLPSVRQSAQHSRICSYEYTDRCLFRQLPCLYALPQCSHFSSPVFALSFLVKRVPSLALRIFSLDLSLYDDSGGPSSSTLPLPVLRSGTETPCGRLTACPPSLTDPSAAFDTELRLLLTAMDPSATPLSTAAPNAAVLAAGEKVELFLRLTRLVLLLTEPSEVV